MANITNNLYDITNSTNSGNILEFVQVANDLTGQVFMMGILLVGFIILFVSMKDYGNQEALVASGFITTCLAVLFATLNFIGTSIMVIIIVAYGLLFTMTVLRNQ